MKKVAGLANITSVTTIERRAHPRFILRCPAHVTFGGNGVRRQIEASTENVSTGGILLQSAEPIPGNSEVEFVITVRETQKPVRLKGAGEVVRLEKRPSGRRGFAIAVKCKRPIRVLSAIRTPFV